ncbi:MAG TPA: hemolysin [Prolixibacteraceae bacterium]|nr:MAG: hemolysin [Bacteroidetes bacterium GWB2_41_8]HCY41985.1 hemolysin [Prolixibacteraceae bacterium]
MDLLLIIFLTILFSAFFSGMEIAFISANKLRLELDKQQNIVYSKLITIFTQNPAQFIATMLIGNNLALVIYGIAFAKLLEPSLNEYLPDSLVLLTQTLISTIIILATAEYLPKMLFRINPNGLLKIFTIPISFFYFLFYPVTRLTMGISKIVLKVFLNEGIKNVNEKIVFSRVDLDHFVNEPESSNASQNNEELDNEVKLFRNALDFSKVKLRDIMVPRTEMVVMDINSTVEELHQKFIETGYSRILFYAENIENIIGYIHHSVIFTKPESIKSNLRNVLIVPETMPASKLLSKFIQQRLSIAIVVDEFGGTAGMVTSEDILEEIFGEIEDEHDTVYLITKQVAPDEFIISGRAELDELNEKFKLDFPENENFETLAGFILFNHESIPKINTIINIGQYRFKILKASNIKIELVHLKILDNN